MNVILTTIRQAFFGTKRSFVVIAIASLMLSGCAGDAEEFDRSQNIRDAYVDAQDAIAVGNYRKEIAIFEALQARFPFSEFATQVQLELA